LELVSANLECLIPQGVYFEVVTKGRLYGKPDAEVIDLVVRRNITVALVPALDTSVASNPLGIGDDQVLTLGKGKWLVDLIVTDVEVPSIVCK
jgi:hypothetical protein